MKTKHHYSFLVHALFVLALNLAINQSAKAGSFIPTGALNVSLYGAPVTLLPNGQVLISGGGWTNSTIPFSSVELYNPSTGTWALTGSLKSASEGHTATLLPNGQVLIAGGRDAAGVSSNAELYNPATRTWTVTGSLNTPREAHTATLLPNGQVLVTGGIDASSITSAEIYNPATGTWMVTGSLSFDRAFHTATLLPNGKVLVAGGYGSSYGWGISSAELYDPAMGAWTVTDPLNFGRVNHTATLLPNGQVLVAGGEGHDITIITSSAELYNPATGTWTATGAMTTNRIYHTATLLSNGEVLVAGGENNTAQFSSAELYNPATGTWAVTGTMNTQRTDPTATLLLTGQVLVVGGDAGGSSAELYTPAPGSLEVILGPAGAVSSGAQWQVDDGAFQNSGAVVNNLTTGNHTVSFSTVTGWFTPANQTVAVPDGASNMATATYLPNMGALQVNIGPPGEVTAGAQWQVDGGAWQNSGAVVNNLPAGDHTVTFSTVTGKFTPIGHLVTVALNTTNILSIFYLPNIGGLQVTINPICAAVNGAQWQVDGGAFQNSGAVVPNLAGGNHTLSFNSTTGWSAPSNQTVMVTSDTTNAVIGNFAEASIPGTITWIHNGGNVNWNNPANWDLNRAPISSDIVLIPYTQGTNCLLDVDPSVAGLVIGDCDGVGSDGLNLNGHTLVVDGLITVKSNAVFGVNSGTLIGTSNTIISGVIGWTSGTLAGTLTLASNGVLNISAATANHNIGGCILTNYGTVNWSGDQLNGGNGAVIYNYGLWNAQDDQYFQGGSGTVFNNLGTFRKSGGVGGYPGTFFVNGTVFNQLAGVIDVQSGTNGLQLTLASGGSFTGGYVTTNRNGITSLGSGNFNINGTTTSGNVVFGGTYLVGTNVIKGVLTWQSGSWNNAVVTVSSNSVLNLNATAAGVDLTGCLLTNYGTVNWSGGQLSGNGTLIYNYGLWNAQDDQYFYGTVFNNLGTFRKSGGANAYPGTFFPPGAVFNQLAGVIDVQNGTNGLHLFLSGGGSFTGGYVTTNSMGWTHLSSGNFNINGTITCSNVVMRGTYLVGTNVIKGSVAWQSGLWNGVVTVSSSRVLNLNATAAGVDLTGCLLTNYGTVNWSGGQLSGNGTLIYNYGLRNAQDDQYFYGGSGTVFNNLGTFRKSGGVKQYPGTLFTGGSTFNQMGGVIDVQAGYLTSQGTYSLTNGTLNFGLNNLTNYGQLLLGSAAVGGALSATVSGNFAPAISNQFLVVVSSSLSGTFSTVNVPTGISVTYTANAVILTVTGPVPVQILSPQLAGTNFVFQFATASGQSYTVQRNDVLSSTNWVFYTNITGSGTLFQFQTPLTAIPAQRFFRVRQP